MIRPFHRESHRPPRGARIDGTGRTSLPAMAQAMIGSEKLRRMEMNYVNKDFSTVRLGAGQTALAMTVEAGHPFDGERFRVLNCTEERDGSLRVLFRRDPSGVKFVPATNAPDQRNYSETWKHSAKHMVNMPRFGKTVCSYEKAGEHTIIVHVPRERSPLVNRAIKSAEGRAIAPTVPAGPTRDEFAAAVRVVNAFKDRMGDALELRVVEGKLKGAIMEEFG